MLAEILDQLQIVLNKLEPHEPEFTKAIEANLDARLEFLDALTTDIFGNEQTFRLYHALNGVVDMYGIVKEPIRTSGKELSYCTTQYNKKYFFDHGYHEDADGQSLLFGYKVATWYAFKIEKPKEGEVKIYAAKRKFCEPDTFEFNEPISHEQLATDPGRYEDKSMFAQFYEGFCYITDVTLRLWELIGPKEKLVELDEQTQLLLAKVRQMHEI